jgi:hypothetical protein
LAGVAARSAVLRATILVPHRSTPVVAAPR